MKLPFNKSRNLPPAQQKKQQQAYQQTCQQEHQQERQQELGVALLVAIGLALLALPAKFLSETAVQQRLLLPDFAAVTDVAARKRQFLDYLYDYVAAENAAIAADREQLLTLQGLLERNYGLSEEGRQQLRGLAAAYGVAMNPDSPPHARSHAAARADNSDDGSEASPPAAASATAAEGSGIRYGAEEDMAVIGELLKRVDELPPSLVLAQAANESAWGMSRFAQQGRALFGQWCFKAGCGMVPDGREAGAAYYAVRAFPSVAASVRSYYQNLNTHRAYRSLRNLRAHLRDQGLPMDSMQLAEAIGVYSQRGDDYIKEIQTIIRQNDLQARYDGRKEQAVTLAHSD